MGLEKIIGAKILNIGFQKIGKNIYVKISS
jgi:hypothetical protein